MIEVSRSDIAVDASAANATLGAPASSLTAPVAAAGDLPSDHPDAIRALVIERDLFGPTEDITVTLLTGGVSSIVARVESARRRVVLKRALAKLKVHDEWRSRVERSLIEARCAGILNELIPGCAPALLDVDSERFAFVMACAPDGSVTWKSLLMAGTIVEDTARAAGTLLGQIHARSAAYPALADGFEDRTFFEELRVDPYLRTIAKRHPDLAEPVNAMIADLNATRLCLVHGDFSPKNLLVEPNGALLLLDHEVAHWGDPSFDAAFVLNHLCLKALKFPPRRSSYLGAASALWSSYLEQGPPDPEGLLRSRVARLLGGLLLARVDGKSPAEYLETEAERARVRHLARSLILEGVADVRRVFETIRTQCVKNAA